MIKEDKVPFGHNYLAVNTQNGKLYVGQTVSSRWQEDKNPIEERWNEEVNEAYRKERNGVDLRYIEKAIVKYGRENFTVKELDIAYSQEELDVKETHYINKYDTMNPDKGYNLKEGGRGGRLSEQAKESLSKKGEQKWEEDLEYREKQTKERRERAKDSEWLDKMAERNQEIARNQATLEKISESLSEKWQESEYQESVSSGVTDKWQDSVHREKQFKSRQEGRREIEDKGEFLRDIKKMNKKDLNEKHDMDGKSMNRRIKEMLGHRGVNNFSQAKKYLENKDLNKILKDINEHLKKHPKEFKGKKEISNKREFLKDIQNMTSREIEHKYNMNRSTYTKRIREMLGEHGIKNTTDAKEYLKDKDLDKVVREINERMSDRSQKYEGTTIISNTQEFLEDIQNLQKNEVDMKYGMDAKTINNKIKEMLGEHGVNNYTEAKEYLKDKNLVEVAKEIENRQSEKNLEQQTKDSERELPENDQEKPREVGDPNESKDESIEKESDKDPLDRESDVPPEDKTQNPTDGKKEGVMEKSSDFACLLGESYEESKNEKEPRRYYPRKSTKEKGNPQFYSDGDLAAFKIKNVATNINEIDKAPEKPTEDISKLEEYWIEIDSDYKGIDVESDDDSSDYEDLEEHYEGSGREHGGEG